MLMKDGFHCLRLFSFNDLLRFENHKEITFQYVGDISGSYVSN